LLVQLLPAGKHAVLAQTKVTPPSLPTLGTHGVKLQQSALDPHFFP
jgi:hypothetical protein